MTDHAAQIQQIKQQALARIAELTAAPKPSYRIEGQEVKWSDYLKQLQQTVLWCDEQLQGQTPFEERTQVLP